MKFERLNNELIDLSSTTIRDKIRKRSVRSKRRSATAYDYLEQYSLLETYSAQ